MRKLILFCFFSLFFSELSLAKEDWRCGVRLVFDSDGSALTPILETAPADIVASLPVGLSELVIAGWQADELAAGLMAAGCGILVEAVHAKARVDATHIAACAAALIEAGDAGEAMTPLYLAPAFLGPAKQAGK